MKKIIFFVFLSVFQCLFSQKYRFVYEYKMVTDISKPDSLTTDYMNLDTDGKKSFFYNATKYETDSSYASANEFKVLANAKNFDLNLNYSIEKDSQTKLMNFYTNYKGLEIVIPEAEFPVWQLQNEYQEIEKMRCQKATTQYKGRNWEAWFTTEIPVSDGPYKFSGLPGLIVKINDTENQHIFELIQVKKLQDLYFSVPKHPKKMTEKEYKKLMENFSYNIAMDAESVNMTSNGMSIKLKDGGYKNFSSDELKKYGASGKTDEEIAKRLRRTNNPIER